MPLSAVVRQLAGVGGGGGGDGGGGEGDGGGGEGDGGGGEGEGGGSEGDCGHDSGRRPPFGQGAQSFLPSIILPVPAVVNV